MNNIRLVSHTQWTGELLKLMLTCPSCLFYFCSVLELFLNFFSGG